MPEREAFILEEAGIDPAALTAALASRGAGACVTFEGRVRDSNEGRPVVGLDYEAYEALALKEGTRVIEQARGRYEILAAVCAHRVGRLSVGEVAVWVGVLAAHRGEAFDACRFIIDEVKARVPIWKREHYPEGESAWLGDGGRAE